MKAPEKVINKLDEVQMCFIVGMGRSGTTLLTNLLNQHAEITALPENNFVLFGKELAKYKGEKLLESFHQLHQTKHNHSLSVWQPRLDFLDKVNKDKISYAELCKLTHLESCPAEKIDTVRFIVDKNPIYSLYIDELKQLFPKAKFIVISRDPRDNFVSRKKHTKGIVSKWTASLASSWNMYYDSIFKSYSKNKKDFHFIRYEDLSKDSLNEMNKIQEFLGTKNKKVIQDPDPSLMENQVHSSDLSNENKAKILEMHKGLKAATNQKRVAIWSDQLSSKEKWFLSILCKRTAFKLGYELGGTPILNSIIYFPLMLITYPVHILIHHFFFFVYYHLNYNLKLLIFK